MYRDARLLRTVTVKIRIANGRRQFGLFQFEPLDQSREGVEFALIFV